MRVKKCYATSHEIAHIWAQGDLGDHGIYSRGNRTSVRIYDDMSYLYSYNTKIAVYDIKNNVVLLSTRTYSNTTQKHESEARGATGHKKQIFVENINDSFESNITDFKNDILRLCQKQIKARVRSYYGEISSLLCNAVAYSDYKKQSVPWVQEASQITSNEELIAYFLNLTAKEKEDAEKARIKAEKARAKEVKSITKELKENEAFIAATNASMIQNWRDNIDNTDLGEDVLKRFKDLETKAFKIGQKIRATNGTLLRIASDGERIQTSLGAFIPVTVAKGLWRRLERGESVDGMSLGHYTINTLKDGILTVGCHQIPFSELEIIAHLLGLDKKSV